jgi:hypothetical protein
VQTKGRTSNVTNIILLIASSSQSSIATTGGSSLTGLATGGGGGVFCVTRSGSLLLKGEKGSDCARGSGAVATSGLGGAGDGAELESFAKRFART